MTWKSRRTSWVLVLAAAGLVGCANNNSNQQPQSGVNNPDLQKLRAERDKFETSEDPTVTPDTLFAAGQLAESRGDYDNAAALYEKCLKQNPDHSLALFRMALLQTRAKQFNQAVALWNRYVEVTKGSATGYSNLALCLELSGKSTEAEAAYKAGIAADAKNQPCHVNYGLMLARQQRLAEAMTQLQAVLTPAESHYNVASVFEAQKRPEQAKQEYMKALQLDPDLVDAKTRLAALERDADQ